MPTFRNGLLASAGIKVKKLYRRFSLCRRGSGGENRLCHLKHGGVKPRKEPNDMKKRLGEEGVTKRLERKNKLKYAQRQLQRSEV